MNPNTKCYQNCVSVFKSHRAVASESN